MQLTDKTTSGRTVDIQPNGQQEQPIRRMAEREALGRSAEELTRLQD
jgi:hypothetical protein